MLVSAVVLAALNAGLSLYRWVPVGSPGLAFVPVLESAVMMWALFLVSRLVGSSRVRRWAAVAIGGLFGILSGVSAAEAFFRFYYARSFAARGDIGMIRGALLLFLGDIGPVVDLITPIVIVLLFVFLAAAGWACSIGASIVLSRAKVSTLSLAVTTALAAAVMLGVGPPSSVTSLALGSWFGGRDAGFVEAIVDSDSGTARDPSDDLRQYRFPGLLDRDIYVFVIEAYGYASMYRPELAEPLEPYRSRLERVLDAHGYGVMTSYLRSPVAGGYSWLAEATLLSGQWIDSQERFLRLYEAELPTLSGTLHEGGYYTLTVRPGTVHGPWPEGWDLYRFEESIVAHGDGFGFAGPWFSYVPVTDQFALWTGHRRIAELTRPDGAAADRPFLAHFQLVSSHTPFNRIPPFIEDWGDLGNGEIYNERADETLRFDNTWTGGTQLIEGYLASIEYVLTVITDYVDRIMDHSRNPIIVILGDHEPQPPIRSSRSVLSVPIHVASRDADILRCFAAHGYGEGIRADQEPPHRAMDSFYPTLVEIALRCR